MAINPIWTKLEIMRWSVPCALVTYLSCSHPRTFSSSNGYVVINIIHFQFSINASNKSRAPPASPQLTFYTMRFLHRNDDPPIRAVMPVNVTRIP